MLAGHLLVRWPNYGQRLLRNFNNADLWGTTTILWFISPELFVVTLTRDVNFVLNDWPFLIAVYFFLRRCQRVTRAQPKRGGVTHTLSLSEAGSHTLRFSEADNKCELRYTNTVGSGWSYGNCRWCSPANRNFHTWNKDYQLHMSVSFFMLHTHLQIYTKITWVYLVLW